MPSCPLTRLGSSIHEFNYSTHLDRGEGGIGGERGEGREEEEREGERGERGERGGSERQCVCESVRACERGRRREREQD